ncbi:hypothetical protein Moror_4602 [Moniliophthora roreri MCA 2997]|uniref:Uncharacterized protein n=2 Tax=Moniliophthora roreri TaxID=221103 RepID=V2XF22_MONRO|nr:hypothetical protein Moror_4602 [Moniliophthora roreri MCA 2997]
MNIEINVFNALQDLSTLTEMVAITFYTNTVSAPYMRAVCAEGANGLALGPLYKKVCTFVQGLIDDPNLLLGLYIFHTASMLDSLEWVYPDTMDAARELLPQLPHIHRILVAFLKGVLGTWKQFSEEYAESGAIDLASSKDLEQAWMPATNDNNKGKLESYRVDARAHPNQSLHQHNAKALVMHNDTKAFIELVYWEEDFMNGCQAAQEMDASGLERKRKEDVVQGQKRAVDLNCKKAAEKKRQKNAKDEHILEIGSRLCRSLQEVEALC